MEAAALRSCFIEDVEVRRSLRGGRRTAEQLVRIVAVRRGSFVKIDAPEMRIGRQKFHSHTLTTVAWFADKDDAAFQLFLREGIHQNQQLALVDFGLQKEQAAMGVDHQGFANFVEFTPGMVPALGRQPHLMEDTRATAA
jgi:hypothetical protein